MGMVPGYDLKEFIRACEAATVLFLRHVTDTASDDLSLNTKEDVLSLIAQTPTERFVFEANEPLRDLKPWAEWGVTTDSYKLISDKRNIYLAFFKNPKNGKWFLKSFKKHHTQPGFSPLDTKAARQALAAAGIRRKDFL